MQWAANMVQSGLKRQYMGFYIVFDIAFVLLLLYLSIMSYQKRTYLAIYEYVKIFLLITLAASFAPKAAIWLSRWGVLQADTYSVAVLIAFGINIASIWGLYLLLQTVYENALHNLWLKTVVAKSVSLLQTVLVVTFACYILMQLGPAKNHIYPHASKTYSYPMIRGFYMSFINDDFVRLILQGDSKTNAKEVILRSFKNSFE